ncbi:GerMN domain-containing protein [Sedimentibacter sp. zth1]|uniref:GerMN domain-containing protein n=1 Tax=Sedimentibacter sp. zth1 TaxID=2816908 RepID=UPI001A9321FC|nr:GerMN domain-containing protein [Sedimentibacter sp. zth1]QSX04886.1 GerMN domain-containing protein [Sedimentibacter sp. zth1]
MKILYHILLIFLIGFFSSTFLFVLSPIDYDDSIVIDEPEEKPELTLSLEGENNLENPTNIVIKHTTNKQMSLTNLPSNIFTTIIYKGEEIISSDTFNLSETTITINDNDIIIDIDNDLTTTLNISQEKLNLKDGSYKIVLTSNLISNTENNSIDINVKYDSGFVYYEATNDNKLGLMGLTIYYPDIEKKAIIPVTRFITKELSLNKQVLNELQQTPKDRSLIKVVDDVNYCIYKDSYVYIDIPASNENYNSATDGPLVFSTITKAFYQMDKYLSLDYIRYTVDKARIDEYFGGIKIGSDIERKVIPKIYLGYKLDDRMYLTDIDLTDIDLNTDIQTISNKILEYYTTNVPNNYYSPFVQGLEIKNTTLNGDNLILNFNDTLLTTFEDDQNKKKFLVDSLIYTFTSLNNVKSISIQADGKPVENFIDEKDITGILTAPWFINPENI